MQATPTRSPLLILIGVLLPLILALALLISPSAAQLNTAWQQSAKFAKVGRWKDAAQRMEQAALLEPWRGEIWEQAGIYRINSGEWQSALTDLTLGSKLKTLSVPAGFGLAEALLECGDKPGAIQVWQSLSKRSDLTAADYQRLIQLQRGAGDENGASTTLNDWLDRYPSDPQVMYRNGLIQMTTDPTAGRETLLKASRSDSALASRVKSMMDAADVYAAAADPAYGWVVIGQALGRLSEWNLARNVFEKSVSLSPNYAEAWAFLAEARQQIGLDGQTELQKAQKLGPDSTLVNAIAALYWRKQGKPELGLVFLHKIAAQYPKDPDWQVELGNTLAEMGDVARALVYFQKAVQLDPEEPKYWQLMAEFSLQYNLDRQQITLPAAREALRLDPENPKVLDLMGWVMYLVNDRDSAERFLQRSLAINAMDPLTHLHLGQVYLQAGRNQEARDHLNQAIALSSDDAFRQTVLRQLNQIPSGLP